MILIYTVLIALATYRLWRVAALDEVSEPARNLLYAHQGRPVLRWAAFMVECVYCLGWWVAGAVSGLCVLTGLISLPELILVWPASSLLAAFIERIDA